MRKISKYISTVITTLTIVLLSATTNDSYGQDIVKRYERGRQRAIDSIRAGKIDTLAQVRIDTMFIAKEGGVVDTVIQRIPLSDSIRMRLDMLAAGKTLDNIADSLENSEMTKRRRKHLLRDTLNAGDVTLMSFIPGLGQVYNHQAWKVPIIYGVMGGFTVAGISSHHNYIDLRSKWQSTIDLQLPQQTQDLARARMNQANTTRTLLFSAAAATYLYQVVDATYNYRGPSDHIRKATTMAAIFPGAGFVYTRTYWRLPIYYGGFITLATVIDYNHRGYTRYAKAFNAMTDNDPTTIDEFNGQVSAANLLNYRKTARRNRDLGIISMFGAYALSIIDTHVIATLKNWDVDPNLGNITIEPTIFGCGEANPFAAPGAGMSMTIRF